MENERNERGEPQAIANAEHNPIGTEAAWLTATEESTGEKTLNDAQAVAFGDDPVSDVDDPIVNGYKGGDHRVEPPIETIRQIKVPKQTNIDY
jgi:hypothetical protein